jgi:glycosyltransferase involved in cell wall biosynthesis
MALPLGVARTIARTRPDVVHLHTGAWYKGALASRLAGIRRVVYTEHGREHHDPRLHRWIDRRAAQFTDAVVAVSSRLSKYLAGPVGIPASKICIIHNGIDTNGFCPGPSSRELRETLGIPTESVVIGSVGRLEAVKAYDVLLEAAAILHSGQAHPFVVVLFGDGSQRAILQAHADRLGISEFVRFSGWTSNPVDAYRLLDVFILPSKSEGQSVSLMEAMACGVTPVVSNVGANAEMLGPELQSNVVEPNRPAELAEAIAAVAFSTKGTPSMSAAVRARATGLYSVERMMSQYEQLYRGR